MVRIAGKPKVNHQQWAERHNDERIENGPEANIYQKFKLVLPNGRQFAPLALPQFFASVDLPDLEGEVRRRGVDTSSEPRVFRGVAPVWERVCTIFLARDFQIERNTNVIVYIIIHRRRTLTCLK